MSVTEGWSLGICPPATCLPMNSSSFGTMGYTQHAPQQQQLLQHQQHPLQQQQLHLQQGQGQPLTHEEGKIYALVVELMDPNTRETALLELSKKREQYDDLALVLWHSFGSFLTRSVPVRLTNGWYDEQVSWQLSSRRLSPCTLCSPRQH